MTELGKKGDIVLRTVPLIPLHEMTELRGTYNELTMKSFYESNSYQNHYLHITLTDEDDVPEAMSNLRIIYPYLMKLDYDNKRTRYAAQISGCENVKDKSPLVLFSEFYLMRNGIEMTEEQKEFITAMIEQVWEDEK